MWQKIRTLILTQNEEVEITRRKRSVPSHQVKEPPDLRPLLEERPCQSLPAGWEGPLFHFSPNMFTSLRFLMHRCSHTAWTLVDGVQ